MNRYINKIEATGVKGSIYLTKNGQNINVMKLFQLLFFYFIYYSISITAYILKHTLHLLFFEVISFSPRLHLYGPKYSENSCEIFFSI